MRTPFRGFVSSCFNPSHGDTFCILYDGDYTPWILSFHHVPPPTLTLWSMIYMLLVQCRHLHPLAATAKANVGIAPFRERLVWFWANHFTVSIRQGGTAAMVGPYLREAIRPNVTNPFFAMLLSVIRRSGSGGLSPMDGLIRA